MSGSDFVPLRNCMRNLLLSHSFFAGVRKARQKSKARLLTISLTDFLRNRLATREPSQYLVHRKVLVPLSLTKLFSISQNVITPSGERRVGKDIAVRVYCRVKSPGTILDDSSFCVQYH